VQHGKRCTCTITLFIGANICAHARVHSRPAVEGELRLCTVRLNVLLTSHSCMHQSGFQRICIHSHHPRWSFAKRQRDHTGLCRVARPLRVYASFGLFGHHGLVISSIERRSASKCLITRHLSLRLVVYAHCRMAERSPIVGLAREVKPKRSCC
jgi:hypothetical protein